MYNIYTYRERLHHIICVKLQMEFDAKWVQEAIVVYLSPGDRRKYHSVASWSLQYCCAVKIVIGGTWVYIKVTAIHMNISPNTPLTLFSGFGQDASKPFSL